ncbi:SDR family NAD(P)-dependent oxidoreductase [Saxibacter everestensis]|uniref:SDR family NAD(P)-dependent oxidoreductase n=1 Tax=Saxibacter everestensis TaxID=2909229 RepID=A0ABY8QVH6_9MICO|nr:SDR family NAD(P)-dependent oxidoreductase [Brevibacteriaceae bacterium ZFBP1038]
MTRALITGGSSGIGLSFAKALAAQGHDIVLVARNQESLDSTARDLGSEYGVNTETISADLCDRGGMETVARRLGSSELPIDILVNNAGFGLKRSFLSSDLVDVEAMDNVLHRAVVVLSHAAAKAMLGRGFGAIINVTSLSAYTTMGPYAASKSAATVFTEALANELRGSKVTATAVLPGFVHSDFHRRAQIRMGWLPSWLWLDADHVAKAAIRDARAGRVLSVPGGAYSVAAVLARAMPRPLIHRVSRGFQGRRVASKTS